MLLCSGPDARMWASKMPRISRAASARFLAAPYTFAAARRLSSVSTARACFAQSAIASRSRTRPVNSCLYVEHLSQAAERGSSCDGTRAASTILTRHDACAHPYDPRHAHPRESGSAVSPPSRKNAQSASSGAPPLMCETRASARDCASTFVSRCALAIPLQSFLCPPEPQCAFWHACEQ